MANLQRQSVPVPVPVTAFGIWLRTGRLVQDVPIEVKFNPWHDRENGRFTFVGQGNYFPRGGRASNAASSRPLRWGRCKRFIGSAAWAGVR
jgi:hypothetical protein